MITPDLVQRVRDKLKANRASYDHFFSTIDDPAWIVPLREAGFFKNPDPPIKQDGYVSFPFWPESQYLLKMVDKAPDEVYATIKDIPPSENQRVNEDILQILLRIDPAKAVRQTTKVVEFLNTPYQLRVQDFAADLAAKFAEAGQIGAALRIAETLLEVKPDPKLKELDKEESKYALIDVQIKYDDHDYQQIIEKVTPALAPADPLKAIDFFSGLLEKAIKYKLLQYAGSKIEDDESDWEDYSTIWRPDIAGTEKYYNRQPRYGLVSAVRDSLSALLESDLTTKQKKEAVEALYARKFKVFKRIVEYVLREYKQKPSFKALYAKIAKELKPITDSAKLRQGAYEFTPSAGISLEELAALSDEEFIDKLKTHQPADFRFEREAFGDLVTALIKENPKRYIKLVDQILTTKYQFVNSVFSAVADKVDDLIEEDLQAILSSAEKFLKQPRPKDATEQQYFDWSKTALTRLFYKIAPQRQDKSEYLSKDTATHALGIILTLCRDPDPTPEHEKQYGGDNMDPPTLSVNTTRGEALHALARMILWAGRNKPKPDFLKKIYEELSWHLDTNKDPSLAIRAVYGQWLPWIWHANKQWATKNLHKIFSDDEYGDAAWGAYITLNQVFDDVFDFLKPVIEQRIEKLQKFKDNSKGNRGDAEGHFAQHLMVYYWRGFIDLSRGGLAWKFFEIAHPKYRSEALRFIGFELRKGPPPGDKTIKRLKELWEYRLKTLQDNPDNVEELEQFGTWFASGTFSDEWSISTLKSSLELAHNADPDFMVLERLSELAPKFPLESMQCLKEMITGARERWSIDSWRENAMRVIKAGYDSNNASAKQLAIDQANRLVAKGHPIFREAIK